MSKDPERTPDEDALDDIVRALAQRGELIPTTEAEVLAAEHAGEDELELPASLREYRPREAAERHAPPRGSARANLPAPRRIATRVLSHSVAVAVGALAAGVVLTLQHKPALPVVTSAGSELVPNTPRATQKKPLVELSTACDKGCCAGSACENATAAAKACPSGQRCISCGSAEQPQGPYRLRFGTMILSEAGAALLAPNEGSPLDLCISAAGSDLGCIPALSDGSADDSWRPLDHVSTTQDLLVGLNVEVRRHGGTSALASWKHPVSTTPEVFCKGLLIQPMQAEKVVGRLSVFVEQTHFVELARAADVRTLLDLEQRVEFRGVAPSVRETAQSEAAHFALTLGPLGKAQAETVRWALLDAGLGATSSYGLDYVGAARKTP